MKHLQLLIPDLFPPQDIAAEVCAGLHVPALEKLLGRAKVIASASGTLEESLCSAFGVQAVAPVRAAADGLEVDEGYWLCADPVNLQLQRAQVLLMPDVMPRHEEALAMCSSLNEHFSGMGLRFLAPQPRRWYVQLETAPQLETTPISRAAWGDAKLHQPQGAEALHWQRIATEVQMLLYAHPFNQAREAQGELLISSLWFWGGGQAMPLKKSVDVLGGVGELTESFARVSAIPQAESLQQMLDEEYERGLWVCEAPGNAMRRGDLHEWREAVQRMEEQLAQPLLKALRAGRLRRLTLNVLQEDGMRSFDLSRIDTWKFWHLPRPITRYAV
jgi:hypothetical protein